jgi:D-glycero-D-manno-heptose 1,7-bisphosphate phosphatase
LAGSASQNFTQGLPALRAAAPTLPKTDFATKRRLPFEIRPRFGFNAALNLCRAVFLDRDGTLIEEREYLSDPDRVALFAGAAEALLSLQRAGFKLFIVSNQSGVGRGFFTMQDVERVNDRMIRCFAEKGVRFDKIYISPEAPGQPSRGRKPSPQFLLDARDEFGLDLPSSYVIGDKLSDLESGWNAGVRKCILVRTGYGRQVEQEHPEKLAQAVVADDLTAAAKWILNAE